MLHRMLAKKLMVRPGSRVAVLGAPPTKKKAAATKKTTKRARER